MAPRSPSCKKAIARENRRRKVAQLARLESDRRAGRLSLAEFRRRYAGLARGEPSDDPAQSGPYGPNTEALKGFIDRVRAMDRAQWDLAEAHLRNLHANSVVRKALLPRYRSALDAAVATARLSAAAALEDAVRASIPQDRRLTWQLTLSWLPAVLVTDSRAASSAIAAW